MKNQINLTLQENQKETIRFLYPKENELVIKVDLIGDNAEVEIFGGYHLKSNQTATLNLVVNHIGQNTKSNTLIKAILDDQAKGHFYGLVNIHRGATGTNTYLKEDALLLSHEAKAEAIPSLEIDENDVKAGHSSAVAPIDQDQLFYLQSRGINSKESEKILTQAFLSPILG